MVRIMVSVVIQLKVEQLSLYLFKCYFSPNETNFHIIAGQTIILSGNKKQIKKSPTVHSDKGETRGFLGFCKGKVYKICQSELN